MTNQYLYILTHTKSPVDNIKVGWSDQEPHIRAKALSKTVRGQYVVEWYMEVANARDAERLAHLLLRPYHEEKEYFNIDLIQAIDIIRKGIIQLTGVTDPYCFEGERLRERNRLEQDLQTRAISILAQQQKERLAKLTDRPGHDQDAQDFVSLTVLDRLEQFVEAVSLGWKQAQKGLKNHSLTPIGEEESLYITKLLTQKQRFDVVFNVEQTLPTHIFGIKWRGYFWHLISIQIRPSIGKLPNQPTKTERMRLVSFVEYINQQYNQSALYVTYREKPVVFSAGVVSVRNHRPTTNRCTLIDAQVIEVRHEHMTADTATRAFSLVEDALRWSGLSAHGTCLISQDHAVTKQPKNTA